MSGDVNQAKKIILYQRLRAAVNAFFGYKLLLFLLAFVIVVYSFFGIVQDYLTNDTLVAVDVRVANLLFAYRSVLGLNFFYGVTLLAESSTVIVAAIVLTAILWQQRQRILAGGLWLALVLSEGAAYLGKYIFHRPRPFWPAISETSFSFPSGHATTVVVFYGFLAYLFFRKSKSWLARILIIFLTLILIILVDFSRLDLGVHYLSDVLAGNLVGLGGLILAIGALEWYSAEREEIKWNQFSYWYFIPVLVSVVVIATGLFWQAPAFNFSD